MRLSANQRRRWLLIGEEPPGSKQLGGVGTPASGQPSAHEPPDELNSRFTGTSNSVKSNHSPLSLSENLSPYTTRSLLDLPGGSTARQSSLSLHRSSCGRPAKDCWQCLGQSFSGSLPRLAPWTVNGDFIQQVERTTPPFAFSQAASQQSVCCLNHGSPLSRHFNSFLHSSIRSRRHSHARSPSSPLFTLELLL